jgi:MtaA/CmuA family methyltransferase
MAYSGCMDDIRTICNLGVPSRVPVFAISEEFDVRWYNRGTYNEIVSDPAKLADCWIAAVEEFDYDWSCLQIDDCLEFEPLGVGCKGEGNILRATCDYLPATADTLKSLRIPDPSSAGRMPVQLEALQRVRSHFGDRACVVGRVAAPFSSAALLYGIDATMMLTIDNPELLRATCDFFVDLQTRFGLAQYGAGAHALWVGDCNAMSNLISLNHYDEFAFEPCRRLVSALNEKGLTFLHASEERAAYLEREIDLGASAVSAGPGADIVATKGLFQGRQALIGNLDPIEIVQKGTPELVAEKTRAMIEACKPGGGYIFNPGEMIPRETPEESIRAMVAAARAAGTY